MVLVRFEFLGKFVNTLAADFKYSRWNWEQTSLKLKTCSQFFIALFKSTLKLEYFEKKDKSHSLSINEIINCERGSHLMSKIPSFMQRFGRQHVNGSQTLLRSARNQLHTTLPLI